MSDDVCTICRDEVKQGAGEKDGLVLKCNHAFHVECIFQYAIDVHQCPNCRHDLRTNTEQPRLQFGDAESRRMMMLASVSTRRIYTIGGIFFGVLMTAIFTIMILLLIRIKHIPESGDDGFSPMDIIIITNNTLHACVSPTNCTTFTTTLSSASQQAWSILRQVPHFWEHNRAIIEGRSLANLLHGLLEECGV